MIQPRYAAWVASLGLPINDAGLAEILLRFGPLRNAEFMAWITRCKASFGGKVNGHIADQDSFTAHCWRQASADCFAAHQA